MVTDRKEPTISSITPERDEITSHQRRSSSRPQQPQKNRQNTQPAAPAPAVVRSPLAPVAFLLAITGLGLAGFVYWQLLTAQAVINEYEQRIVVLEQRLDLSDDESSQSVTAIRAKLKWADSEIRKLWGVSYDRNRKTLESHTKQIGKLEKSLKKTTADGASVKKLVSSQKSAIENVKQQGLEQKLLLEQSTEKFFDQQQQVQSVTDLANRLERQVAELKTGLSGRVTNNEEAIEAIDAHRLNINRELLQLRQQLQGRQQVQLQ